MSLEINAENRNIRMNIPTRRCCSFCRNTGHNITTCNDERLLEFERLCINRNSALGIAEYRNWLLNYSIENPNIVRAYAVRYCGCSVRSYLFGCIDLIITRISEITPLNTNTENSTEFTERLRRTEENVSEELRQRISHSALENLNINLHHNGTRYDVIAALEMLRYFMNSAHEEAMRNRKFHIQTNIIECSHINDCECNICYESKKKPEFIKLNCGHEFCKDCIKQYLQNVRTEKPLCAFCRSEIINMELTSQEIQNEFNEFLVSSS